MNIHFWEQPLETLDDKQWEALCDGCGQCCLVKLQDDETDEIFATDVVCRYHELGSGKCSVYSQRSIKKPDCFVIERDNKAHYSWLPKTCAYRLRAEKKPLFEWHPLIQGNRQAMLDADIAITDWAVCETNVSEEQLAERVIFSLSQ